MRAFKMYRDSLSLQHKTGVMRYRAKVYTRAGGCESVLIDLNIGLLPEDVWRKTYDVFRALPGWSPRVAAELFVFDEEG